MTSNKNMADKQTISSTVKRNPAAHLVPHHFKPGQSGNPKGRPKETLTKRQRYQLLSVYAKMNPEKANPINAIQELNKMDHIYDEKPQYQDNRHYTIVVQGDEAKARFNELLAGKMPQDVVVEGETIQDVGGDE